MSGRENNSLASEFITSFDFTFENKTSKWRRIQRVEIDFGSPEANQKLRFLVGKELLVWADSVQQLKIISDHNTSIVLGSIAAAGAIGAATSTDRSLQKAGSGTFLAATSFLTAKSLSEEKQRREMSRLFPESHLMAEGFIVPPGLHAKKWVAVYTSEPNAIPYLEQITLEYTLDDGVKERVVLAVRKGARSSFQHDHPIWKERQKANMRGWGPQ